jgi:hypothetical protein
MPHAFPPIRRRAPAMTDHMPAAAAYNVVLSSARATTTAAASRRSSSTTSHANVASAGVRSHAASTSRPARTTSGRSRNTHAMPAPHDTSRCPDPLPMPLPTCEADLYSAAIVIAVKEAEHRAQIARQFPGWPDRVRYWNVHDLDQERPSEAVRELENSSTR